MRARPKVPHVLVRNDQDTPQRILIDRKEGMHPPRAIAIPDPAFEGEVGGDLDEGLIIEIRGLSTEIYRLILNPDQLILQTPKT